MFQWQFDEAQMTVDNVGAPVTPQQWNYIHIQEYTNLFNYFFFEHKLKISKVYTNRLQRYNDQKFEFIAKTKFPSMPIVKIKDIKN